MACRAVEARRQYRIPVHDLYVRVREEVGPRRFRKFGTEGAALDLRSAGGRSPFEDGSSMPWSDGSTAFRHVEITRKYPPSDANLSLPRCHPLQMRVEITCRRIALGLDKAGQCVRGYFHQQTEGVKMFTWDRPLMAIRSGSRPRHNIADSREVHMPPANTSAHHSAINQRAKASIVDLLSRLGATADFLIFV